MFAFLEVNVWDVPMPTWVKSKGTDTSFRASWALLANWTLFSPFLIIKRDDGNKVVVIPRAGNSVDAIPIADDIPVLLSVCAYDTSSPVTKKWFGNVIVFAVTFTTSDVEPS